MKKTEYITFRTSEEVKTAIENIAKDEDRTISYILNRIITDYIEGNRGEQE